MVHVRFGGEGLVCLGDQDPASYPTKDGLQIVSGESFSLSYYTFPS